MNYMLCFKIQQQIIIRPSVLRLKCNTVNPDTATKLRHNNEAIDFKVSKLVYLSKFLLYNMAFKYNNVRFRSATCMLCQPIVKAGK